MDLRRIALPVIMLVTDRKLAGGERSLVAAVADAVSSGVNLVQMREKDLSADQQIELGERLNRVVGAGALFFVNGPIEVAQAVGADGLQLSEGSIDVPAARARMTGGILIGRSVHDMNGARTAVSQGADLLVVGTVYESRSHRGIAPAGVDLIDHLSRPNAVPVVGIGGITSTNAKAVIEAGGSGVAVISSILSAGSPGDAAADLVGNVMQAWSARSLPE